MSGFFKQVLLIGIMLPGLVSLELSAKTVEADTQSTYFYTAYVKGTKTHKVEVSVHKDPLGYKIWGKAKAIGLAGFLSRFKSRFLALGRIVNNRPVAESFELDKTSKKSTRTVRVDGDTLNVTRNGVIRPPKKSLAHIDVLSAFFMMGDCADTKEFHTGRHGYAMTLKGSGMDERGKRCDYHLVDDDLDVYDGTVWLGDRNGFVVPLHFEFDGAVTGRIVLDPT
jgi:hypothetical protein